MRPPCADATRTLYPPRLPSDAAASPAPVNTSCGPTTSIGCTPSKATKTTPGWLMDSTFAAAQRWRQRHIPHTFGHNPAACAAGTSVSASSTVGRLAAERGQHAAQFAGLMP
jgi:hypothetical protein